MTIQRIGYYDDGELRAGTGRYLAEIIGALDRTRFQPLFFAACSRPWHDDLARLNVERIYGVPAGCTVSNGAPGRSDGSLSRRLHVPAPVSWTLGLLRN